MDIRPIKTEDDYAAALADIDRLLRSPTGSRDDDRLEALATLVEAHEAPHWLIDPAMWDRRWATSYGELYDEGPSRE